MTDRVRPARGSISATSLAKLGLCEHQLGLDMKTGELKATKKQTVFLKNGTAVHERSLHAAMAPRSRATDQRCFIATAVYGTDAEQTWALRAWRDRVLMASIPGRVLVRMYYRCSPLAVAVLARHPAWLSAVRRLLDGLVRKIGVQP